VSDDDRDPLICLRVPPAMDAWVRAEAERLACPISAVVRSALDREMAEAMSTSAAAPRAARKARKQAHAACEHRVRAGAFCPRCQEIVK
jgi:hypothetical protein